MKPNHFKKHTTAQMHRRSFLKGILATGTVSIITPRLLFGADASPSGKVNLACCGIGNRGAEDVKALHDTGLANIVALCDTDMGAPHTQGVLKMFPDVPRFQDFRQMFDKMGKDIEAVSVAVPDFSHFAIAMMAMSLGKHVYCEKPMGHSFRQIELMMQAEKKYKVAAQMGNQGHSEANYFQFKAWTEAGIIKNVTKITAYMNSSRRWHDTPKFAYSKLTGYLPKNQPPARSTGMSGKPPRNRTHTTRATSTATGGRGSISATARSATGARTSSTRRTNFCSSAYRRRWSRSWTAGIHLFFRKPQRSRFASPRAARSHRWN